MIKKGLQKLFNFSGYRLTKNNKNPRNSFNEVLKNIKNHFDPDIIIDVGAAIGDWSLKTSKIFPNPEYILVEPINNYLPALKRAAKTLKNSKVINNVASDKIGPVTFNINEDFFGSSLKNEAEGKEVDGKKISVESLTLNKICENNNKNIKYLLKIDTQGSELEVLKGAGNILSDTECIILETSFFQSFIDGPTIFDVISFMKQKGFIVYDIYGLLYRPYDDALCQADVVFVKEKGIFRNFQGYATKEQRNNQNEKMKKILDNNLLK